MIFDEKSTNDDKVKAFLILQTWKVRRSQETAIGVLCTLSLLDVYVQDITGKISDRFTLSNLYSGALTKFINHAASFQLRESTMYRSAYKLGIDSFLIDLRHLCSHGKQLPSLEVFRKSHRYCLGWIKKFYWESELLNISDATAKEIRVDATLTSKLQAILPLYDTLAELIHKNLLNLDDPTAMEIIKQRAPSLEQLMKEKNMKTFRKAFKAVSNTLVQIVVSKQMRLSPSTFFHEFFHRCEFFMQVTDVSGGDGSDSSDENDDDSDETETEESPAKRKRVEPSSAVNLLQNLVWQIAKFDHLKMYLDLLFQISSNDGEDATRRASASFWMSTTLRSFRYYQMYCEFSKNNAIVETKVTEDVRRIYSYQLDADLRRVFIFVGSRTLPSTLKYSREFFNKFFSTVDNESVDICANLLPFVYPPLSAEQLDGFSNLIRIGTKSARKGQEPSADKVYTVADLFPAASVKSTAETSNSIWEKSTDNIDWSAQPIGKDFSLET